LLQAEGFGQNEPMLPASKRQISDHQQSWRYEEGSSKGPGGHALLVVADLLKEFWLHITFSRYSPHSTILVRLI
jgi:hypothetical protein